MTILTVMFHKPTQIKKLFLERLFKGKKYNLQSQIMFNPVLC